MKGVSFSPGEAFAANRRPRLVLSGIPLTTPYVGQGTYTLRLIQGLVRRMGDDFIVIGPPGLPKPSQVPGQNFLVLPSFQSPRQPIIYQTILAHRILRFVQLEFPAAVFHSPGPMMGWAQPATTVVTLHDCLYRHFPNYSGRFGVRRAWLRAAERFAASASLVLTDSEFSKRDLVAQARIPEAKIEIVYPWVGNEFFDPISPGDMEALRARLHLPERFWLYLGGYDYRKNIEFLLEAYAEATLRRDLPPLVLAGNIPLGDNRAHCDVQGALERLGLTNEQVIRPGLIPAADLPALYRSSALFVYPSLMEGFGLPPAEAIAVKTPVLSSNSSSLPEVVGNSDCLFDPTDSEALIEKLLAAAEDEAQFLAEPLPTFTERCGINQYLRAILRAEGSTHV